MKPEYLKAGLENTAIHVVQEASELIKDITKCQLFGWGNHHPDDLKKIPNWEKVLDELSDLSYAIARLRATMSAYQKWMQDNIK